jgi:hypothetical protein
MTVRPLVQSNDNKHQAPAAGQFGIVPGIQLRAYRPSGCPSLEQFEARFRLANDRSDPLRAA